VIQLQIPNAYRSYTGSATDVLLVGETINEVFADLLRQHPALRPHLFSPNGKLRPYINLFVNGENIRTLQGMETKLKDGDSLRMVASIAGG
jgi:molybdopterin converting factor small subunit